MITSFYLIVFILSVVMLGSFLIWNKKVDTLFILFSLTVTVNCLGRYLVSSAENLEKALLANRFLYIGASFSPLLAVFILARLSEKTIPRILKFFLIGYSTLIICLVMTIGKYRIYYKHVGLVHGVGHSYLVKEYGPLHVLFPIMMLMYGLIMIVYMGYAIKKRNQLSLRLVTTLCGCCLSLFVMYILERVLRLNVSILPIGYLVGIFFLTGYFNRVSIYDMSSNIVNTIEKMNEYGYIVFDSKYRYINSNAYLKEIFPEINQWIVDKEPQKTDSFFYHEVIEFLYDWDKTKNNKKTITFDDKFFDVEIRIVSYHKKEKVGYLIEFVDRTLEIRYYNTIKEYNASLEKEVAQKTKNIVHIKDMMVLGMADMVESRDPNTGGHIKRTSAVVKIFSRELEKHREQFGLDHVFLKNVEKAAPMHDLGKIAIDDVILRKPGKYTPEEFAQMKKHSAEGARIVGNILQGVEDDNFVEIAKNVAHYHHEKWNGQGYPSGLSGTDIPIEARIMALADVFDALVSKRCYKEAFSYDDAFQIIKESLGQHFDPELGKVFMDCRPWLEEIYDQS